MAKIISLDANKYIQTTFSTKFKTKAYTIFFMLLKLPLFQNKQTPKQLMIVALLPLLQKKKKKKKKKKKHKRKPPIS
jgi:hypothetical protein